MKGTAIGFAIVLFLVTFGVYGASLRNGFVRFDDGLLITENPAIRSISPSTLTTIFTTYDPELYIPLTLFSYQLDYQIGGTHPFVYHLHNLLLHTLNAFLVAWVVCLLSREKWLAAFVGLVFAIHPLHTEAVAWASARKDVLSTVFFLGALIAHVSYRQNSKLFRNYLLSLSFFLLGLLSKVMVLTLPLVLLLVDVREGRKWNRTMCLEKVPYFLLSILFGAVALFGKREVTAEATIVQTTLMAAKSTVFYLQKLFIPTGLSVLYPYTEPIRLSSPDFFLPLLILLVLFVLSLRFAREILFGFLFFLITLAPTFVNFSKGGDYYFASDRYAYLPSVGMFFLVAGILLRVHRSVKFSILPLFLAVVVLFGGLTVRQSLVWADTETLFRNVVARYPHSHRAHNNLGNALRRRGNLEEALAAFQAALAIKEHPKTLSNLGAVYRKLGRMDEALVAYEKALAIAPDDPEPHFGLGIVYAQEGKFPEALASYERALALDPAYGDVLNNMGALYIRQGQIERAIETYRKALAVEPLHYQAHYNLAVALESLGKREEARREYESALSLESTFTPARLNLGILLYGAGEVQEAKEQFRAVLAIDPENLRALSALQQLP